MRHYALIIFVAITGMTILVAFRNCDGLLAIERDYNSQRYTAALKQQEDAIALKLRKKAREVAAESFRGEELK